MGVFRKYLAAILISAVASIAAAQTPKAAAGISPVPLWPANGDTSQLMKDHYVFFDLPAGEYVAAYPTDFDKPDTSETVTQRFGVHSLVDPQITSLVDPQITSHVGGDANGAFTTPTRW